MLNDYWSRKKGEKTQYRASFVGYFPADNPTYTCVVVITDPTENGFYGSQVALPVFREISDRLYATSATLRRELVKQKVKENIDDMDLWIHQLIINGAMADLKCFAFKVDVNESAGPTELEKFEGWMNERIL